MEELYDEYDNSTSHNAWWTLPDFIEWLKKQRNRKNKQTYSINLTIILHSACIIEGFLYEMLSFESGTPTYKKDISDRLLIDLNMRLENASWLVYQDIFKIVFGKRIIDYTTNQNWKALTMLFVLRNMLTHGKTLELKFYDKKQFEPVITGKYSTIYTYFKEIKLIDTRSKDFTPGGIDFVNEDSADFFYKEAKFLMEQLYKKLILKSNWLGPVEESYKNAFNLD